MLSLRTDELRQLVFAIIASPFFSILAYFGGNQWRGGPTLSYSISFGETVIKQCVFNFNSDMCRFQASTYRVFIAHSLQFFYFLVILCSKLGILRMERLSL